MIKLVIVEDERIVALDMKIRLQNLNYKILDILSTGEEAVETIPEKRPDLILMDIRLGGKIDGIEAAALIRDKCHIPVVFVTAFADRKTLERAKVTEAFGYILKPFQDRELQSNIEIALYRHKLENNVRLSEEKFRAMIEQSTEVIVVIDSNLTIQYISQSIKRMFGYEPKKLLKKSIVKLIHPDNKREISNLFNISIERRQHIPPVEFKFYHKDNSWRNVEIRGNNMQENQLINGIVLNIRDITDHKNAEAKAKFYEYHDTLTRLPNRELFLSRLEIELEKAKNRNKMFFVMSIGIDKFKVINKLYGSSIGDLLLKKVGLSLGEAFRPEDLVACFGGDKFTILLSDIYQESDISLIVNKATNVFLHPFEINAQKIQITASIGICIYPHDGTERESLLNNGETAMYMAKEQGGNTYRLFDSKMNKESIARLKMEKELHEAILNDEFVAYYQPKVRKNGEIIGMESLIRWQSSRRNKLIPPVQFIPIAEKNGMIIDIGKLILHHSCKQNKKWQDAGYKPMRIAVNLSPTQFRHPDLIKMVVDVLQDTNLDPKWLELEITETGIMENELDAIQKVNELHDMNISISIDDFGTGYSSLSKLKDYPVDTLKIDKSFIDDLPEIQKSIIVVRTIIDLAHNLDFKVVAEGVENKKQLDFLDAHNCDQYQGYYFFKPLPVDKFEQEIKKA